MPPPPPPPPPPAAPTPMPAVDPTALSASLFIDDSLDFASGLMQYGFPFGKAGLYSCITFVVDLAHVCDPLTSYYHWMPFNGCESFYELTTAAAADVLGFVLCGALPCSWLVCAVWCLGAFPGWLALSLVLPASRMWHAVAAAVELSCVEGCGPPALCRTHHTPAHPSFFPPQNFVRRRELRLRVL